MTSLLEMPPPGDTELALTDGELVRITGASLKKHQIEWLKANRWRYTLTRAGEPVVGRLYANLKMAGVEVATMVAPEAWAPDFDALLR